MLHVLQFVLTGFQWVTNRDGYSMRHARDTRPIVVGGFDPKNSVTLFALKALAIFLALLVVFTSAGYALFQFAVPAHYEAIATLIGAGATIFAGWLAWESLTFQAQKAEREKEARAQARKIDFVIAITQAVHAASALYIRVRTELAASGDREGASARVKRAAKLLDQVLDKDILLRIIDELNADDRANMLLILGTLGSVVAIAETNTPIEVSKDEFAKIEKALRRLDGFLVLLGDRDLHNTFIRDTGIKGTHQIPDAK